MLFLSLTENGFSDIYQITGPNNLETSSNSPSRVMLYFDSKKFQTATFLKFFRDVGNVSQMFILTFQKVVLT